MQLTCSTPHRIMGVGPFLAMLRAHMQGRMSWSHVCRRRGGEAPGARGGRAREGVRPRPRTGTFHSRGHMRASPRGAPQHPQAHLSGTTATAATTATRRTSATGMATVMAAPAARGVVGMVAAARRGTEVGTPAGHPPTPPAATGAAAGRLLVAAVPAGRAARLTGAAAHGRGHGHGHPPHRTEHDHHEHRGSPPHRLTLLFRSPEARPRSVGAPCAGAAPSLRRAAALAGGLHHPWYGADARAPSGAKHS